MDYILNNIDQIKYDFLGPIAFTIILLIGIGIGFLNGYKTAAVFLIFNTISLVAVIVIFNFSKEISEKFIPASWKIEGLKVKDIVNDGLAKTIKENPKLEIPASFIKENKGFQGIYDIVGALSLLIVYVGLNIFIFIPIYLFFRKRLKESMFKNQRMGISNIKHRLGGAAFGFVISIPVALIISSIVAALGNVDSNFTSFISKVTNFVFLGKVNNIPKSIKDLVDLRKYF